MEDRSRELLELLRGAIRDAAPVSPSRFREEALIQGFGGKDVSRVLLLATSNGEAVLDGNMELVEPGPENPFYEFG